MAFYRSRAYRPRRSTYRPRRRMSYGYRPYRPVRRRPMRSFRRYYVGGRVF